MTVLKPILRFVSRIAEERIFVEIEISSLGLDLERQERERETTTREDDVLAREQEKIEID